MIGSFRCDLGASVLYAQRPLIILHRVGRIIDLPVSLAETHLWSHQNLSRKIDQGKQAVKRTITCMAVLLIAGSLAASSGHSAETPAQWLVAIEEQAAVEKAGWDADWRDVMRGAALALEPYDGRPEVVAKFAGERKRIYDAYLRIWNQHGRAVADQLLAGQSIDPAERKYRFLVSGTLVHRYQRHGIKQKEKGTEPLSVEERRIADYAHTVEQAGRDALRKGYQGNKLTAGDIDALRDYAMFVDARCTGNGVLPSHLGLTRSRYGNGGFRMPGEAAPDFSLARMEAFLDTPEYSDQNPRDPVDILTPLAAKEFLQVMCGFELRDGRVAARPYEIASGAGRHYARLSDYRGEKPVLMVFMNATDPWAWHGKIAPLFEPLKQALGDRVATHFICTTIHDTRMPSMDFLGTPPERTSYVHETAMEHRARICKMFYMGWPQATTDYLLDDMAQHFRNQWMDQGGGAYIVLVDTAGTIAYVDYHKDIPPHWGPQAVSFPYEFLTIRMNHLESRLAGFFANGGLYDEQIETDYPGWRLAPQRDTAAIAARFGNAIWMSARVLSVDLDKGRVFVERKHVPREQMKGLRFWDESGDKAVAFDPIVRNRIDTVRAWVADPRDERPYALLADRQMDIFVNGWPRSLDALRPGDDVGVCCEAAPDMTHVLRPIQIRVYRFPHAKFQGAARPTCSAEG